MGRPGSPVGKLRPGMHDIRPAATRPGWWIIAACGFAVIVIGVVGATVESHVRGILAKTQCANRIEFVAKWNQS